MTKVRIPGNSTVTIPREGAKQDAIQFEDEGASLGSKGTVNEIDFTGTGVTGSRNGDKITYNIPGGSGSGDVVGPSSSLNNEVSLFSGTTGKLLKNGGGTKDGTGGFVGLTLFAINFKNALNTFTSFFTNANTASRTYTFQDRTGTIADLPNVISRGNSRYISAVDVALNLGTGVLSINTLRCVAIPIRQIVTITSIGIEITTGTSGNIRLGIYNDDGSGQPGTLLVDSGQLTISAPGVYVAAISKILSPGIYWLGYLTDTSNTARTISTGNSVLILGVPSTFGNTPGYGFTVAKTYGALPDPYTAGFTIFTGTAFPYIGLLAS